MMGAGRLYVVPFVAVAVTAQQDLLYLKPAADKPIILEAVYLNAVGGSADAGDGQEELLDVEIIRLPATVTVGSGGTSVTPTPVMPSDTAAGFTARANDTTKATTSGTALVEHPDMMNNRAGWPYAGPAEHREWCFNAQALVVRLNTTVADSILLGGVAKVRELG